ncbi:MAG: hypothetical protein NC217_04535 [Muribaculaceae bacterium]|nr:hypothetical protein [Muribaculaceae bacterium]
MAMLNKNEKSKDTRNLFYENVWLFLDNAEMIINTPALFYAPTSENIKPVEQPGYSKIGVWVKWWKECQTRSRDTDGNPVVYFIGSPFSGMHSCMSVGRDGELIRKCPLHTSWMSVMKSYCNVNDEYKETAPPADAMNLSEAIDYVRKHSTPEIREASRQGMELCLLRDQVKSLRAQLDKSYKENDELKRNFLKYYVESRREEIGRMLQTLAKSQARSERYKALSMPIRIHHKKRLKQGEITQKEFQYLLTRIRKRQEQLDMEVSDCRDNLEMPILYKYSLHTTADELNRILQDLTNTSGNESGQSIYQRLLNEREKRRNPYLSITGKNPD